MSFCTAGGGEDQLVLLNGKGPFGETRGHRAIGVVYHPEYEHLGNYVPTVLSRRYDALLFIDETHALHRCRFPSTRTRRSPRPSHRAYEFECTFQFRPGLLLFAGRGANS